MTNCFRINRHTALNMKRYVFCCLTFYRVENYFADFYWLTHFANAPRGGIQRGGGVAHW